MQNSVLERLGKYLQEDTLENFLSLRKAVAESAAYDPYADDLDTAEALLEQGQLEELAERLLSAMGNRILNPSAHMMASFVFRKLSDEQRADTELGLARVVLEGILSTGDGSQERPYLVLCTADEYDVLERLGKQVSQQSLVEKDGKHFDRHACQDGTEVWFDVTTQLSRLDQRRKENGREKGHI
jgi:hypothetical protein